MALTKEDLQSIGELMDGKLSAALEPINVRLDKVDTRLDGMQDDLSGVKSDLSAVKSDLSAVKSDLSGVKSDLSDVKQRVTRIEITQENTVAKQIGLLAEGHIGIVDKLHSLDTLAETVEDIQTTVDVLKHINAKK